MLEPQPIFKHFQFVQEIAFKNKDSRRSDLGIERFGFVISSHVIHRNYYEHQICFASSDDSDANIEYSLRPLSESEIWDRLSYIKENPTQFQDFIQKLNNQPELKNYHI